MSRRRLVRRYVVPVVGYGLCVALVTSILFFRLDTAPLGLSPVEHSAVAASSTLRHIAANPIGAPHKLGTFIALKINGPNSVHSLRAVSALFGLVAAILFYLLLRQWLTRRMALLGSLLFASSSWFLHSTRLATPDILLTASLALALSGIWLQSKKQRTMALFFAILAIGVAFYIPGLCWLVLGGLVWRRRAVVRCLRQMALWQQILVDASLLALIAPLVVASSRQPSLLFDVAGLPRTWPGWSDVALRALHTPESIFIKGPLDPLRNLGRLPLLSLFESVMVILGVYVLILEKKQGRSKLIGFSVLTGGLLIALGGLVSLTWLLPFVYLLVAMGVTLMMQQWLTVFPRNPLARAFGVTLLVGAVLVTSGYQLRRYFVAWPNAPETRAAFRQKS